MDNPDALVKFAVQQIVHEINAGMNPQDATEKVAVDLKLSPNFIKRASEAINVAPHYNHFKKHAEAKADDFPIVDAQKIAENIYGGKEKTAAEAKSELFSSFQSEETTPKFARYLEDGPHKAAYEKIVSQKAETEFPLSEQGVYEKSANYLRDLKKTAEDKEAQAKEADFEVSRAFCRILEKFAKAPESRAEFATFESQAFTTFGEKAMPYVDLLYKTSHLKEARGKHDPNYTMFTPCEEVNMLGAFMKKAEALAEITKTAEEAKYNYQYEKAYVDDIFRQRGRELHKAATGESYSGTLLEKLEQEMSREREKIASMPEEDPVLATIKQKKEAQLAKEGEQTKQAILDFIEKSVGQVKDMSKPSLSVTSADEGSNRERAFVLQELATTDPILAKIPTKKVVEAYQQMLRIAPEISREKELVRAHLRNAVQGQALSIFDANSLVEGNTKLLEQRRLQQGLAKNPGKGPGGEQ